MMDANEVISEAVNGHVKQLAQELEVSKSRVYEMLGTQCVYSKCKRLIRAIAKVNPDGVQLIHADLMALFAELAGLDTATILTDAQMSQELHDPFQARLEHRPKAERLSECRQAIVVLAKEIAEIEKEDKPQVRVEMAKTVEQRRNGHR
jgi:hypothetical protein